MTAGRRGGRPRIMSDTDHRAEQVRKRRAPVYGVLTLCSITGANAVPYGWAWLPAAVFIGAMCVVATRDERYISGHRRGHREPPGGQAGGVIRAGGRDGDGGPAVTARHQWTALLTVSRLMPTAAGRRWLAEAESVLAELPAARRGAAVRSYLRSAPSLAAAMWMRAARRRRPGQRRPG